ncbi:oxidoreductase [Lentibacillus sp. N15]|uniref:WD40/YVTN/BNR-like repeat-containing protein n=1 Tax=Lentibacillus songyuanensis TaxID=3136161 RepID=UPI0031BB8075
MKKLILIIASVMMISLIIASFFYQNHNNTLSMPRYVELEKQIAQHEQAQEPEQTLYAQHTIDYSLQNDQLNITFDKGKNWINVPIDKDKLFAGDYNGSEQELIEDSYVLTKNRVAFLYSEGENWEHQKIIITYSLDQGKTWQDSVVTDPYPSIRFRKVDFLDDDFGYAIISGDRTMSQEGSSVFLTHDGGKDWEKANGPDTTRLLADGGFIDQKTGFLSYGTINPEAPDLYVTQNAGDSWEKATFHMPKKYDVVFVSAEVPVKEGNHLVVLVNQGPNGDYLGGEVKGKFISDDHGRTWDFEKEVEPNETDE